MSGRRAPRDPWWLLLLPGELRREHREEIVEHARIERAHPRFAGRLGRLRFSLWLASDLARTRWRFARGARESARRGGGSATAWRLLVTDARHAWRAVAATPLQSAVVALTLACGIGLGTAVFAVIDDALLEPLDYRGPDRLVYVFARWRQPEMNEVPLSGLDFRDVREQTVALEDAAAAMRIRQNLIGAEVPLQVEVGWVSPNLFRLLGVEASQGRLFASGEPEGTVVLSEPFFRSAFAGEPSTIGRRIELDGRPYTVIGVAPPGFRLHLPSFSTPIDLWKTPDAAWENGDVWRSRQAHQFHVVARLLPGATLDDAGHALATVAEGIRASSAEHERLGWELLASPLEDHVVGDSRPTLLVLFGAVGCLGLIACANVANLMLARGRARRAELAVRAAMGASRLRLLRLGLLESAWLAVSGGVLAIGAALAGRSLLEPWRPAALRGDSDPLLDLQVLVFAAGATLASLVLSGMVPALASSRVDLQGDLKECRGLDDRRRRRPTDALVVLQMALSVCLLCGAALLLVSLERLQNADLGFDPRRLYTFAISLPGTRYEWPSDTDAFFRAVEDSLGAAPGIESIGLIWPAPLSGRSWTGHWTADGSLARTGLAQYRLATPGFFSAAEVRFVDGREFRPNDPRNSVVVSRSLAEAAWPEQSALGRRVEAAPWAPPNEWFEVVGVVEDVRYDTLRSFTRPQIYFDSRGWSWADWEVDFVVRSELELAAVVAAARSVVAQIDPTIPVARARPLGYYLEEELAPQRYALGAFVLFAVLAAGLAVLGLYGVLSTYVLDRRREIGIRVALGSERGAILRLVLASGMRLVVIGLVLGWLGALSLGRFLQTLLFEVRPREPSLLLAVSAALLAAAVVAAWLPARRATRLDPLAVLRG